MKGKVLRWNEKPQGNAHKSHGTYGREGKSDKSLLGSLDTPKYWAIKHSIWVYPG